MVNHNLINKTVTLRTNKGKVVLLISGLLVMLFLIGSLIKQDIGQKQTDELMPISDSEVFKPVQNDIPLDTKLSEQSNLESRFLKTVELSDNNGDILLTTKKGAKLDIFTNANHEVIIRIKNWYRKKIWVANRNYKKQ